MLREELITIIETKLINLLDEKSEEYKKSDKKKSQEFEYLATDLKSEIKDLDTYKIAVVGGTGLGKSTFLNALMSKVLLPSQRVDECTGVVVEIKHDNDDETSATIINHNGSVITRIDDVTQEKLFEYINHKDVQSIQIETAIGNLAKLIASNHNDDVDIIFIDTPGYDTDKDTGGVKHTQITYEIIKNAHLILAFLEFDKDGRWSNRELLETIVEKQDFADLEDKLYIILNKIEGAEYKLAEKKQRLLEKLSIKKENEVEPTLPNIKIDKILGVGSLGALYCRLYPEAKTSDAVNQLRKDENLFKEQRQRLREFAGYREDLEDEGVKNAFEKQLELSNIKQVEKSIADYLNRGNLEYKILKQLLDKAKKSVEKLKNDANIKRNNVENNIKSEKSEFEKLFSKELIEYKKNKLNEFNSEKGKLLDTVESEIIKKYKRKLSKNIKDTNNSYEKSMQGVFKTWTYKSNKNTTSNMEKARKPIRNWLSEISSHINITNSDFKTALEKEHDKIQSFCNDWQSNLYNYLNVISLRHDFNLPEKSNQEIVKINAFNTHNGINAEHVDEHIWRSGGRQKNRWANVYFDMHVKKASITKHISDEETKVNEKVDNHFKKNIKTAITKTRDNIFEYFQKCIDDLTVFRRKQMNNEQSEKLKEAGESIERIEKISTELTQLSKLIDKHYKNEQNHA